MQIGAHAAGAVLIGVAAILEARFEARGEGHRRVPGRQGHAVGQRRNHRGRDGFGGAVVGVPGQGRRGQVLKLQCEIQVAPEAAPQQTGVEPHTPAGILANVLVDHLQGSAQAPGAMALGVGQEETVFGVALELDLVAQLEEAQQLFVVDDGSPFVSRASRR